MYIVIINITFKELFTQIFQHVKGLETHVSASGTNNPAQGNYNIQIFLNYLRCFPLRSS